MPRRDRVPRDDRLDRRIRRPRSASIGKVIPQSCAAIHSHTLIVLGCARSPDGIGVPKCKIEGPPLECGDLAEIDKVDCC